GPPELRARLALTMGVVYRSLGLYRDSRPLLDLAVGTFEETGPDSDPLADALVERGRLLTDMETDMELGREGFERALALKEALYGADSPEWATSALHAAVLLKRAGAFDETADLAASAARRLSFHPELQSDRAFALGLYGSIESRRGNHDTALDALKRALALSRNSEPQDLIVTATLLNDLSVAYSRASDQAAAISTTRALLAVDREIYGDEHPYVVSDLHNLAMMNYLAGNPQESLPLLIKVFELRVDSLGGENHPAIGEIYKDLGLVRLALNDVPAARSDIERGLAIITKELGTLHFRTAIVLSAVARLRRETGDLTGAIETMKQVRDIFAETLGRESPRVTKSEAFIAEVSSQLEQARRSP
ncbi:MAG: tetratricopeptide repeat protein, partial [Myxococcota bacterium]